MKTKFKSVLSWLFRDSLQLQKHWWHRLVKVIFLSVFFLVSIASYIAVISAPDRALMREHNITIKNSLYDFTANYTGGDSENTIPKFFEQEGEVGVLVNKKIEYISSYTLGNSFCVKTPEKYKEAIVRLYYDDYKKGLSYGQTPAPLEGFSKLAQEKLFEDSTRKCFLYGLKDEDLKKIENLSKNIVNYKPNFIFYVEATIAIPIICILWFIFFALIYYRLFLYVIYGNKK